MGNCSAGNLNGYYHGGKYTAEETRTGEYDDGVLWNTWTNDKFEALTKTRMSVGQDKGYSTRICDVVGFGPTEGPQTEYDYNYDDNNRGDDSDGSSSYYY